MQPSASASATATASATSTATASATAKATARAATTEIMGGLGNQLFQIFNLMAYSFHHKTPFYFPFEQITQGQRKTTYWSSQLLQALQHFVKPSHQQPLMYHERNFHYEPIPSPPPSNIKFFGYFQSYKYFQDQQEVIYKFIKLRETQAAIREKTQHMYDYNRTVALHFRVGDYKNLPNHHPLMSLEYYTEALTQLLKDTIDKSPNVDLHSCSPHNILYFCEEADLQYVQEKMLNPLQKNPLLKNKFTFQCIDHNLSDWEQLIVMSLCSKHIIANSTFSWWGAYLGLGGNPPTTPSSEGSAPSPPSVRNAESPQLSQANASGVSYNGGSGACPRVYYPATWFGPAIGYKNLSDLFPSHWHRINI